MSSLCCCWLLASCWWLVPRCGFCCYVDCVLLLTASKHNMFQTTAARSGVVGFVRGVLVHRSSVVGCFGSWLLGRLCCHHHLIVCVFSSCSCLLLQYSS